MKEAALAHKKEFETLPDIMISVPQATTLIGTFSEYVKGWSLSCNTSSGITLTFSRRDDNVVRIVNSARQDRKKFTSSTIKYRREDKWANAVKAVFYELGKLKIKCGGFNILLSGRGSGGTSSSLSSQLFVGTLYALNEILKLNFDKETLFSIALSASSFSPANSARYRDLWLLVYGEENMVYLCDEKKHEIRKTVYSLSSVVSCLFDSDIPYSVLTPEYEEFKLMIPDIIKSLMSRVPPDTEFRKLGEKDIRYYTSKLQDRERRALLYLSAASEYAREAFEEIASGDGRSFGRILSLAQRSLIVNAELTSPELDWIFRRCRESKAVIGMASIDVGTAGSFLCVVDENEEFPNNQRLEEYERIFGFHPKKTAFVPSSSTSIVGLE